jgi:hypothetical protein
MRVREVHHERRAVNVAFKCERGCRWLRQGLGAAGRGGHARPAMGSHGRAAAVGFRQRIDVSENPENRSNF